MRVASRGQSLLRFSSLGVRYCLPLAIPFVTKSKRRAASSANTRNVWPGIFVQDK